MMNDRRNGRVDAQEAGSLWRFTAGDEFELSGGRGRLERLAFGSGLVLYRSEIEVAEDCTIDIENGLPSPWVGTCTYVLGRSVMETPDGQRLVIASDRSVVLRVDRSGTRFHFPGGQTLRHVGVSAMIPALKARLGGSLPDALLPFAGDTDDACIVREVAIAGRTRALATSLFSPRTEGPFRLLVLEALAAQLLADIVETACLNMGESGVDIARWERLALADAAEYVQANLESHFLLTDLAANVGLSPNRLDELFRGAFGCSPAAYVRRQRLREANRLLETGDLPIKEVAVRVGYGHVSNFSRAYSAHFGETPARTLRRLSGKCG